MAAAFERAPNRTDDQAANALGVAKADLGLGRVNIDIDHVGRRLDEQGDDRMTVMRQHIQISAAQRAAELAVLHRAAIDEEILLARRRAVPTGGASATALRRGERAARRPGLQTGPTTLRRFWWPCAAWDVPRRQRSVLGAAPAAWHLSVACKPSVPPVR